MLVVGAHIPGMEPPVFWALLQGLVKYYSRGRITAMGDAEGKDIGNISYSGSH